MMQHRCEVRTSHETRLAARAIAALARWLQEHPEQRLELSGAAGGFIVHRPDAVAVGVDLSRAILSAVGDE